MNSDRKPTTNDIMIEDPTSDQLNFEKEPKQKLEIKKIMVSKKTWIAFNEVAEPFEGLSDSPKDLHSKKIVC